MNRIENRKMERYNLEVPARVSILNKSKSKITLSATTKNVCACGAYLLTDHRLETGTKVNVGLILTLRTGSPAAQKQSYIKVSGVVVRVEDTGLAIRFNRGYQISAI